MSGKKQKGVVGWFECSKCKKRISRQLATKHSGDEESGCRPVYPFLKGDELHCVLTCVTPATRKIGELPFVSDQRLASSTIFVSEELIRECGLTTFGWVVVTPALQFDADTSLGECKKVSSSNSGSSYAFRVWPIPESIGSTHNLNTVLTQSGSGINSISVNSKFDGSGDAPCGLAVLRKLSATVKPTFEAFPCAAEIFLTIENFEDVDEVSFQVDRFTKTVRRVLQGRPVTLFNKFKVRFYAQFIIFHVSRIVMKGTAEDETLGLENLSLNESLHSSSFAQIATSTIINIRTDKGPNAPDSGTMSKVTLADIGGLTSVVRDLCSTVKFIMSTTLEVPKGILLYGHTGVGKSLVVQAIVNEFNLFPISYDEFKTTQDGRKNNFPRISSSSLEKIFRDAAARAPSAIIVDALEVAAPRKTSDVGGSPVTQFATDISRLVSSQLWRQSKILLLFIATELDKIDPTMRSAKILAKEIEIPVPTRPEREEILEKILKNMNHSLSSEDIKLIASNTHGFVGADLRSLCNQASLNAIQNLNGVESGKVDMRFTMEHIQESMKSVKPSAIKSILMDVPNVRWEDIGGQDDLKFKLKQAIEWPLKHPESFLRLGITPPKGILMYGPPGCSKTMIAKAIATESGLNFISVKGSELFSKWVGESEKAVQGIFRKARQVAPCVIFFDEIDSLGGERGTSSGSSNVHERVLSQILIEIDGVEALKDVTIVAATNRPDRIDQALLRPGRLDRIIYVPLPDSNTRREILKIRFKKMPVDSEVDLEELVRNTKGYSGAELTAVCHEAALKALEEDISCEVIQDRHFKLALLIVKPRITQEQIDFYKNYSILRSKS